MAKRRVANPVARRIREMNISFIEDDSTIDESASRWDKAAQISYSVLSKRKYSKKALTHGPDRRSKLMVILSMAFVFLLLFGVGLAWYLTPPPRHVNHLYALDRHADPASVTPEDGKAVKSWAEAAATGNTDAMAHLGSHYLDEQDYAGALEWYSKAAAAGNPRGMYGLGILYRNGQGVTLDPDKALEWEEKAAAARSGDAKPAR